MINYHIAYIGLGSNLENPEQQISDALTALENLPSCRGLRCSHWYSSKAVGPGEQPDYINAAVTLETTLSPPDLLSQLQAIENQHGRQRDIRWGARTLDLDLLLYGDTVMETTALQLPHPEILNRNFVLYPLNDLSPSLILPNGQVLSAVINSISLEGLSRIEKNKTP